MDKKFWIVLALSVVLVGFVVFEEVYMSTSFSSLKGKISILQEQLELENLQQSKDLANNISKQWEDNEGVICLFVDYRDISEISKQTNLIISHLNNNDFELARVECNYLKKAVETFENIVTFDWQNVI